MSSLECKHGQLARQCPLCELEEQVRHLECQLSVVRSRAVLHHRLYTTNKSALASYAMENHRLMRENEDLKRLLKL
jgi:hypothetical protein